MNRISPVIFGVTNIVCQWVVSPIIRNRTGEHRGLFCVRRI